MLSPGTPLRLQPYVTLPRSLTVSSQGERTRVLWDREHGRMAERQGGRYAVERSCVMLTKTLRQAWLERQNERPAVKVGLAVP